VRQQLEYMRIIIIRVIKIGKEKENGDPLSRLVLPTETKGAAPL
jgi:hypothetical protein